MADIIGKGVEILDRNTESDRMEEACGVFGIYAPERDVASLAYYGLVALQHRGQESAGIAVADGDDILVKRGMGLVNEVFTDSNFFKQEKARLAVGHVRYSTTGGSSPVNSQPLVFRFRGGKLAVSHNGNLVNAAELRERLEQDGSIFQTTTDSEIIAHLIARYGHHSLEKSLPSVLPYIHGAFAFVLMTSTCLLGLRDSLGIRPLSLGQIDGGWLLASETCAFDTVGGSFLRDLEPGEMVIIDQEGVHSLKAVPSAGRALCIFEYIYFSRPDSNLDGENVHLVRRRMGRALAQEQPVAADLVIGVPDSSISAASAYAEELGLPYEIGLIKNRYIGRTFIQPSQDQRERGVRLKLNPVRKIIAGKRVVLVDDSIVRGTTSRQLVSMLRGAGAGEVHLRIASPPVCYPCYYGIDTSTHKELVASGRNVEQVRELTGADSLGYLSIDKMLSCLEGSGFCLACFNGEYPV